MKFGRRRSWALDFLVLGQAMGGRANDDAFWRDEWQSGEPGDASSRVVPRLVAPEPAVAARRVSYGPAAQHFADLRLPTAASAPARARGGRSPVAVFVHGGFWKSEWALDLEDAMADDLARRGWASWNIEYRRVGFQANEYVPHEGAGWPGTFQDVATALDKLADVAAELEEGASSGAAGGGGGGAAPPLLLDLQRVVLIGHSAGGHLALWLAQAHRQDAVKLLGDAAARRCRVKPLAVVGQAPVADLLKAFRQNLSDEGDAAERFMGGSPESVGGGSAYPAASPAALLPLGCAQLLVSGTDDTDVPIALTREYVEDVRQAGGDAVTLLEFPGSGHYELITPTDPTWLTQRAAIERLLEEASATAGATAATSTTTTTVVTHADGSSVTTTTTTKM